MSIFRKMTGEEQCDVESDQQSLDGGQSDQGGSDEDLFSSCEEDEEPDSASNVEGDDPSDQPGDASDRSSESDDSAFEPEVEMSESKTSPKNDARKSYKPGQRYARKCPLCVNSRYKYLSQHLQRTHQLKSKDKRMRMLGKAREREPINHGPSPKKRRRTYPCPVKGCHQRGLKRPDLHIRNLHNVKLKSTLYRNLKSRLAQYRQKRREKKTNLPNDSTTDVHVPVTCHDVVNNFHKYIAATKACTRQGKAYAKNITRNLQLLKDAMGCSYAQMLHPSMPEKMMVTLAANGKQPKTISNYLFALKRFCHFLTIYDDQATSVLKVRPSVIVKTQTVVDDFMRSTRSGIIARQSQVKSQIGDLIIDGKYITDFLEKAESELQQLCRSG
ncbi:uncharacterized protein LOC119732636 [Patiria miniata]|uniref:Uncharacterized protein n=1 Tax=Patiria miniata TaxID=46514 RepID=A0A914AFA4_PATMI|nr:uncharacterized protein LOC119732636 [Patiria miniata]